MSEEFAHKKKLWIYTSVDPVAFSFVHLQLFFTRESVSLMLHLKKKILFSITAAIILGSMPLSGNAWEAEPEISGVSLQQAPDQMDVSAAGRTKYDGYIWRLDAKDRDQLPRRFRTANSAFRSDVDVKKTGKGFTMPPSRKGLDRLNISGSAEFSVGEFKKLVSVLKKQAKGPIYIVDLRQETHGIFNGNAVSWFGARDWGNIGKNKNDVLKDEMRRLCAAKGKSLIVTMLDEGKKSIDPKPMKINSVMSERQLVEQNGLYYYRIAATDHIWPSPENIDDFISFIGTLPDHAWLHFHCRAGKGRTTIYMAMYDMMKNPDISLEDILSRQYLLGGNYIAYEMNKPKQNQWKAAYYHEKAAMIAKFYQYVQETHANHFTMRWSRWLKSHLIMEDASPTQSDSGSRIQGCPG